MLIFDLFEGRDAPLYHGCDFHAAVGILKDNTFLDKSYYKNPEIRGVSLSRNIRVSKTFGPVVFALDQAKLQHRYKILTVDFWGNSPEAKDQRRTNKYAEAEEFVVGKIINAEQYILAINVDRRSLQHYEKAFPVRNADFPLSLLTDHPLVKFFYK